MFRLIILPPFCPICDASIPKDPGSLTTDILILDVNNWFSSISFQDAVSQRSSSKSSVNFLQLEL